MFLLQLSVAHRTDDTARTITIIMSAYNNTIAAPVAKTYLLHGFRWPRRLIRIHIILQKLDDIAADWIVGQCLLATLWYPSNIIAGPESTATLLANFREQYPAQMANLPTLRFVEQLDLRDTSGIPQDYAYVSDVCVEVRLGVDVDEIRGRGIPSAQWGALQELRDHLNAWDKGKEKEFPLPGLGWYVVHCGDELRERSPAGGGARLGEQEEETTEEEEGKTLVAVGRLAANKTPQVTTKSVASPYRRALQACSRKARQG